MSAVISSLHGSIIFRHTLIFVILLQLLSFPSLKVLALDPNRISTLLALNYGKTDFDETAALSPTSSPSYSPTYGPASDKVVSSIITSTLAAILIILIFYFYIGYHTYENDIAQRMLKHEEEMALLDSDSHDGDKITWTERSPLMDDVHHQANLRDHSH